jgi:hypothetical protein
MAGISALDGNKVAPPTTLVIYFCSAEFPAGWRKPGVVSKRRETLRRTKEENTADEEI